MPMLHHEPLYVVERSISQGGRNESQSVSVADISTFVAALPIGPRAAWWEEMHCESVIRELSELPDGWDGYGALSIGESTAAHAVIAIRQLCNVTRAPEIVPNSNGTLSLLWDTPEGRAHLEIGETRFSFYVRPAQGMSIFLDGAAGNIPPFAGKLISAHLYPHLNVLQTLTNISFARNDA